MSDLAFLLAVQAVVRGERAAPPGLGPPQRDEVSAWIAALANDELEVAELRTRLGISASERGAERPKPVRFVDVDLAEDAPPTKRSAFRWHTHRGGVGMIVGLAVGLVGGYALTMTELTYMAFALGGVALGKLIGSSMDTVRCSNCATVVGKTAERCKKCGAQLKGDIKRLAERLEAEERLETNRDGEHADDRANDAGDEVGGGGDGVGGGGGDGVADGGGVATGDGDRDGNGGRVGGVGGVAGVVGGVREPRR